MRDHEEKSSRNQIIGVGEQFVDDFTEIHLKY